MEDQLIRIPAKQIVQHKQDVGYFIVTYFLYLHVCAIFWLLLLYGSTFVFSLGVIYFVSANRHGRIFHLS
jgi:hypothetical protein